MFSAMKLGKQETKHDERTLKLGAFVNLSNLPPAPDSANWAPRVGNFPVYLNDQIGDCAIAGPAHMVQTWTANDGKVFTPTDAQVVAEYEKVGGYRPGNPSTDNGCVLLDVLRTWRNVGFFGGHRIGAFATVEPSNLLLTNTSIYLLGCLCIGLALPVAAQSIEVWDLPRVGRRLPSWAKGSWGGHCVEIVGYAPGWYDIVTWGRVMRMSVDFYHAYCDESYCAISRDWLGPDNKAPNGFNAAQLTEALKVL